MNDVCTVTGNQSKIMTHIIMQQICKAGQDLLFVDSFYISLIFTLLEKLINAYNKATKELWDIPFSTNTAQNPVQNMQIHTIHII